MMNCRAASALVLLCLAFTAPAAAEQAHTLRTDYSVTVRGFPVGAAHLRASFGGGDYRVDFTGGITGLARLFSDAKTNASVSGRTAEDRPRPLEYSHVWVEKGEEEDVRMLFAGRGVKSISLTPPREHPERYVPLTKKLEADAFDPVSAFLLPAGGAVGPDTCARTLQLIDGKRRFDLELSFRRSATFKTSDGTYSGPIVVCGMRYVAIAGHKQGKEDGSFAADAKDNEVWFAPAGDGMVAPIRLQFRSRIGRIVMQARTFKAE